LDIAEGPHKGAFAKYPIRFFQLTGGEQVGKFKGVMESFNKSNNPQRIQLVIQAGIFYADRLAGALIGGCLRDEEYLNKHNQLKIKSSIAYLCSTARVKAGEVQPMATKYLDKGANQQSASGSPQSTGNAPPHGEDDLPNW
jgi:hypothetical protein